MHQLVKNLQTEHVELQHALAGIRPRQFRTDEGRTRLERVRKLLRSHISAEQTKLYPALEKAAKQDKRLAAQLKRMNNDMKIVTDLAEGFFEKYREGKPKLIEFATDHGALLTILRIRLRREEETLFPLFDQLSTN